MDIGKLHLSRCEVSRAIETLERTLSIREEMRSEYRDHPVKGPATIRYMFQCQGNLSDAYRRGGLLLDAKHLAESSLALRRSMLTTGEPDERKLMDIAVGEQRLAAILLEQARPIWHSNHSNRQPRPQERSSPETRATRPSAHSRCAIGATTTQALLDAERSEDALARARQFVSLCDALESDISEYPKNREYRALSQLMLGKALVALGERREAKQSLGDAWDGFQVLSAEDPTNIGHRLRLAETAIATGDAANDDFSDPDTSRGWYLDAQAIYDQLAADGRLCGVDEKALASLRARLED
jgi:hypothetical protein